MSFIASTATTNPVRRLLLANKAIIFAALLAAALSATSPYFLLQANLLALLDQIVVMTVVALGYTLILAMGEIDLSLGGVIPLIGIVMAKLMANYGVPFELAIVIGVLLGAVCGAINATLISRFDLPPFIVTLATGALFTGTLYIVSNLIPVSNLPEGFLAIARTRIATVIPLPVILLFPIAIAFYLVAKRSVFGQHVIALGGNPEAVRVAGINIEILRLKVYALAGVCYALAAVLLTARSASAQIAAGSNLEIEGVDSRLQSIAFDVGQHFSANFKETGLKGQLAAPSKRAAIQLKKLFDEFGVVTTEVVISAPEMRESEDEVDEADDDLVRAFWRKMMERYGGEEAYNRTIVEQFKGPGDPDIIIVVDKLLTGFDAPRNTVLYVARRLREHGLLQAIARVNRVFDEEGAPEKPFGFIIDYTGVLKDLGDALASYDALQGFSPEDIASSVLAIREEASKVPGAHAALIDVFKSVSNSFDAEAYARLLADEEIRAEFYERLSAFSRAFTVALASPAFIETTKPELLKRWKDDLGRFVSLRAAVTLRYAERVDWRDYEKRIRQLLDRHVIARDVVTLVEPLNIFDDIAIEERRQEKTESDASVADTIAHQLTPIDRREVGRRPSFFREILQAGARHNRGLP